jgi:hypothetical protein
VYLVEKPLPPDFNPKIHSEYIPEQLQKELPFVSRHYQSFWEAARECADSRLMGGIHTRHDNEVGLAEGIKVGGNINALRWSR